MSNLLNLPAYYLKRDAAESPMLTRLRAEREAALDFVTKTVEGAESRDLSATELETLERTKARVAEIDAQIKPLADFEALRSASAAGSNPYRPTGGAQVGAGAKLTSREFDYPTAGHVLADAARAVQNNDADAISRLESVGLQIVEGQLTHRAAAPNNTSAEIPGIMPQTIQGGILSELDAARPFISSVGPRDMGSIPGKVFSRPVITQHVRVGEQTAELAELPNRQFKVDGIDFMKVTRGGWALVSRQSIDWSSPAVWNALLKDFQDEYAIDTEAFAVYEFETFVGVTGSIALSADATLTLTEIVTALYAGASSVYAARKILSSLKVWQSVDQWAAFGSVIDSSVISAGGNGSSINAGTFGGSMLTVPRVVVPAMTTGTTIIGPADRFEVYENRVGFLSVVAPKVMGTEIAYGGDLAVGGLTPVGGTIPFFRIKVAGAA